MKAAASSTSAIAGRTLTLDPANPAGRRAPWREKLTLTGFALHNPKSPPSAKISPAKWVSRPAKRPATFRDKSLCAAAFWVLAPICTLCNLATAGGI
jgi:hypothetical protein